MDIVEFFQRSSGKWFSQRTSHNLMAQQTENGKSDFQVELLAKTDRDVIKLCEQSKVDPDRALCGIRVSGDGSTAWDKETHTGQALLVPIADANKPNEGTLLHAMGDAKNTPVAGRYVVGTDEALTLINENETTYAEERLWFASPNLRLRTSLVRRSGGFSVASFYTEIRKGVTSPPAATNAQASLG